MLKQLGLLSNHKSLKFIFRPNHAEKKDVYIVNNTCTLFLNNFDFSTSLPRALKAKLLKSLTS